MEELALKDDGNLRDRIKTFLADPSFSADTRRTYRTALEKFATWIQGKTFAAPREAVVEFVRHLQSAAPDAGRELHGATASLPSPTAHRLSPSRCLRPNTVQLYKAAVMSFLGYHGVVVGRVKSARRSRHHLKDAFTPEEVRKMMDAWTGEGFAAVRNRALIALLATTGLRQVEAWRADEADLRVRDGIRTLVIQGKGEADKNNFVVIGPEAWAYLRDWLKIRERILSPNLKSQISNLKLAPPALPPPLPSPSSSEISNLKSEMASSPAPSPSRSEISNFKSEMASSPSPALFLTTGRRTLAQRMTRIALRKVLEASIERAGLKDGGRRLSGHSLRHTFVTTYLEGGGDMWKAQAAARHRSPETTQVYQDNVDRLKDAPEVAVSRKILRPNQESKR